MSAARLFSEVRRILGLQLVVMGMIAGAAWMYGGAHDAGSAFLGGLVGFLPNAYFAAKFGYQNPKKTAQEIVRAFYLGETIKLIITALLFILAFQLPGVAYAPLFIGFISVMTVFWFALLINH